MYVINAKETVHLQPRYLKEPFVNSPSYIDTLSYLITTTGRNMLATISEP